MDRRDFVKGLAVAMAAAIVPISLPSQEYDNKTYLLKTSWSPELVQDLNAYHNLDAEAELRKIVEMCLEKELGDMRGTITKNLVINSETFQPLYKLTFKHDGKYGRDTLWGLENIIA